MADNTQANKYVVLQICRSGDVAIPMKDLDRTHLFHWIQFWGKHTKVDI